MKVSFLTARHRCFTNRGDKIKLNHHKSNKTGSNRGKTSKNRVENQQTQST